MLLQVLDGLKFCTGLELDPKTVATILHNIHKRSRETVGRFAFLPPLSSHQQPCIMDLAFDAYILYACVVCDRVSADSGHARACEDQS